MWAKINWTNVKCCKFDVHEWILIIFGRDVAEKVRNQMVSIFPPHLLSVYTLPGETGNPEIASFQ